MIKKRSRARISTNIYGIDIRKFFVLQAKIQKSTSEIIRMAIRELYNKYKDEKSEIFIK